MQTSEHDEYGSTLTRAGAMWELLIDEYAALTWNFPGAGA